MAGRFSSPVLPGETLNVWMWLVADGRVAFQTRVEGDGRVAIDHGEMTFTP